MRTPRTPGNLGKQSPVVGSKARPGGFLGANRGLEWHRAVAPGVEVGEITAHGLVSRSKMPSEDLLAVYLIALI